jgi:hypothetical protein
MPGDVDETDLATGAAQGAGYRVGLRRRTVEQGRDVDDGNGAHGHLFRLIINPLARQYLCPDLCPGDAEPGKAGEYNSSLEYD